MFERLEGLGKVHSHTSVKSITPKSCTLKAPAAIYYLMVSVDQESRHGLAGSLPQVSHWLEVKVLAKAKVVLGKG